MEKFLTDFPLDFQQKILSYRRWQDAQLSLLGRLLLNQGLLKNSHQKTVNSKILYTQYYKPYFEGEEINFNISHSGEIVVCAISEPYNLGIDIEIMNDINIDDFKSQMNDNEWKMIVNDIDQQTAFYNYWTQKEAVMKAHGKGLSIPLQSFEVKDNKTCIDTKTFYVSKVAMEKEYMCYVAHNQNVSANRVIVKKVAIQSILSSLS